MKKSVKFKTFNPYSIESLGPKSLSYLLNTHACEESPQEIDWEQSNFGIEAVEGGHRSRTFTPRSDRHN